jgi:predicted CoA-binding protein
MYNILKRIIEQNNYKSIDDIRNKVDVFFAVEPARLTETEYKELNDMLNAKQSNIVTP